MSEIGHIEFCDDRALRAWCVEQVWLRMDTCHLDETLELSKRLYDFVVGKEDINKKNEMMREEKKQEIERMWARAWQKIREGR